MGTPSHLSSSGPIFPRKVVEITFYGLDWGVGQTFFQDGNGGRQELFYKIGLGWGDTFFTDQYGVCAGKILATSYENFDL